MPANIFSFLRSDVSIVLIECWQEVSAKFWTYAQAKWWAQCRFVEALVCQPNSLFVLQCSVLLIEILFQNSEKN